MDQRLSDQLDKVIAMADSSHEGEAIVAVRKARQLLQKGGLSFGALAQAASSYRPRAMPHIPTMSGQQFQLEMQILQLRQRMDALQNSIKTQDTQLEFWRRRALDLEQALNHKRAEAARWRNLASDTVDKLWDLGQSLKSEEFASPEPAADKTIAVK